MIEKTWLELALSIGIPYTDFWGMTPHIINLHMNAHQRHMDEINTMMYVQGLYVRDAIASSICNSFRGHNKAYEYPKEPYELRKHELTESEKQKQVMDLFNCLQQKKERFDATHKTPV